MLEGCVRADKDKLPNFSLVLTPLVSLFRDDLITREFAGKHQKSSAGKLITQRGSRKRQRIYGSGTLERGVNL